MIVQQRTSVQSIITIVDGYFSLKSMKHLVEVDPEWWTLYQPSHKIGLSDACRARKNWDQKEKKGKNQKKSWKKVSSVFLV